MSEEMVTVFTSAPREYDYGYCEEAGTLDGCRVVDMPASRAEDQMARYKSGLYWATTSTQMARHLRRRWPWHMNRSASNQSPPGETTT